MNIKTVMQSARLYARSEAMVAEIRLRVATRKIAFITLGILTGVMGLAFINVAAYIYLQTLLGPVWTPLAIGLANFAIAAIAVALAISAHPGPELAMAKELRNAASSALEDEFQTASPLGSLAGALGGGSDSRFVSLLLPAVISIISALSKRKAAPKK